MVRVRGSGRGREDDVRGGLAVIERWDFGLGGSRVGGVALREERHGGGGGRQAGVGKVTALRI